MADDLTETYWGFGGVFDRVFAEAHAIATVPAVTTNPVGERMAVVHALLLAAREERDRWQTKVTELALTLRELEQQANEPQQVTQVEDDV